MRQDGQQMPNDQIPQCMGMDPVQAQEVRRTTEGHPFHIYHNPQTINHSSPIEIQLTWPNNSRIGIHLQNPPEWDGRLKKKLCHPPVQSEFHGNGHQVHQDLIEEQEERARRRRDSNDV